ncbi:hypothetical protein RHSIM_Rhsim07G0015000 [Rhododendron simsii]|uniref:Uncharacterized protein n=1 Tax=Rhododendron simsii TaxID=118357 RepID=A0A834GKT1_RHOSS|nr:hypothetical protein RHSIM_Rhsim07G0015000 [Rhododendron simsii]
MSTRLWTPNLIGEFMEFARDMQAALSTFVVASVVHVLISRNEVANWVASSAKKGSSEGFGQLINLNKSCVVFSSNTPKEDRQELAPVLGVPLQAWRLLNWENGLWARVLKGNTSLTAPFGKLKKGPHLVGAGKAFLLGEIFRLKIAFGKLPLANCLWQVSNGKSVNILRDKWAPGCSSITGTTSFLVQTVADLILPGKAHWNEALIRNTFDPLISTRIFSIPLPHTTTVDNLI